MELQEQPSCDVRGSRSSTARSSCFDTDPACPVTTSAHLPPGDNSAALWELLPGTSLSAVKLGVSYRKEDHSFATWRRIIERPE